MKTEVLGSVAERNPEAIVASNTSSLSITELGSRIGAPARTVGTHYWNPPLLMPLVEVVRGAHTSAEVEGRVVAVLRQVGKRPIRVGDVPGFVWNRLQMAVLREAAWIVENGVAYTVDEILADGLARRWRNVGFFRAIALGGVGTWERIAGSLFPDLSTARSLNGLGRWVDEDPFHLLAAATSRDQGLARDLRGDRLTSVQGE